MLWQIIFKSASFSVCNNSSMQFEMAYQTTTKRCWGLTLFWTPMTRRLGVWCKIKSVALNSITTAHTVICTVFVVVYTLRNYVCSSKYNFYGNLKIGLSLKILWTTSKCRSHPFDIVKSNWLMCNNSIHSPYMNRGSSDWRRQSLGFSLRLHWNWLLTDCQDKLVDDHGCIFSIENQMQ